MPVHTITHLFLVLQELMMPLNNFKNKLLHFLQLQLFINLISLPILVCWGLPISSMSIMGNLLFSPVLTLFLLLATLIFFTELLYIPNTYLVIPLEWLVNWWSYALSYGSTHWLLTFAQPSWLALMLIPATALAIVHHKKLSLIKRCVFLLVLSMLTVGYLTYARPGHTAFLIACKKGAVLVAHSHGQTILIDPGYLASNGNLSSWVHYTLIKELNKHIGSGHIDHCIFLQPSARVFEAVTTLAEVTSPHNVYLPSWRGSLKKHEWRKFFAMRSALEKNNAKLIRVPTALTLTLSDHDQLSIMPCAKTIRAARICYPAMQVRGRIGSTDIEMKSLKNKGET